MNDPQTQLQANRQNEEVQTQWQGAAPQPLQDNGSTIPTGYLNMDLRSKIPQNPYQPPSTGEIHKQMWIGSMMLALMAGLASGNASAAIVGGMWGAIGIHDYGNTLRQRAQWTDKLQKEGYSGPAILKWYEDGDTSGLDKERNDMLADKREAAREKEFDKRMTMEDKRMAQQDQHFNQQMNMQGARLAEMERHQGIMERVALQNAGSARLAAIAKMGGEAGGMVGQGAAAAPHLQNASFDPSKVPLPPDAANWSDREKAAYINAAAQAFHGEQLKQVLHQEAAAKNLRTSESQQTGMYDKILTAAQKVNGTPNNQAGDTQLLMQFQVGESPNVSPRTTQIAPIAKELTTGTMDKIGNWFNRTTGQGLLTDAGREQARDLTRSNAEAQAKSHMEHVQNVVTTEGYDLNNPQVMADLVAAFHVSPDTIKGLASGSITPDKAAQDAIGSVSPRTTNFADVKTGKEKKTEGSW